MPNQKELKEFVKANKYNTKDSKAETIFFKKLIKTFKLESEFKGRNSKGNLVINSPASEKGLIKDVYFLVDVQDKL